LRFLETCHQVTGLLSCGSSERWRSPGVVGPYWLGPPFLPFARMVFQARSASRFSDTRVERGVASNTAFYLTVLRRHCRVSPQRRVIGFLCLTWLGSATARGRQPNRNRGRLRIRLSRLHPRVGLDDSGTAQQASLPGGARGTGLFNTFRSQDGSVLGLGPFVTRHLSVKGDGRAASVELRHFAGEPAG
jgi:hypothetical protein